MVVVVIAVAPLGQEGSDKKKKEKTVDVPEAQRLQQVTTRQPSSGTALSQTPSGAGS